MSQTFRITNLQNRPRNIAWRMTKGGIRRELMPPRAKGFKITVQDEDVEFFKKQQQKLVSAKAITFEDVTDAKARRISADEKKARSKKVKETADSVEQTIIDKAAEYDKEIVIDQTKAK